MGGNEKGAVKGGDLLSAPSAQRQALHVRNQFNLPSTLGIASSLLFREAEAQISCLST